MKKTKNLIPVFVIAFILLLTNQKSYSHCEIPCGIYGDSVRIALIKEHIATIEKSMKMITELSKESTTNYNQIVRWVMNKEEHAEKIQEIVSQYFLHQRVKPIDSADKVKYEKYIKQLALLHQLSVYSMKAKQSTDLTFIKKLMDTVGAFEESYFHSH